MAESQGGARFGMNKNREQQNLQSCNPEDEGKVFAQTSQVGSFFVTLSSFSDSIRQQHLPQDKTIEMLSMPNERSSGGS